MLDQYEGRCPYFILGRVTDVESNNLVRVKAFMGSFKQDDNGNIQTGGDGKPQIETSDWIVPALPGGIEAIPNKDDLVIIGFIDGNTAKPFYFATVTTNQQNRPTEHMVLGDTLAAVLNDHRDKIAKAITTINDLVVDVGNVIQQISSTGLTVSGSTAKTASPLSQTSSLDNDTLGKLLGSDGSAVSSKSGDQQVLSSKAKVRK